MKQPNRRWGDQSHAGITEMIPDGIEPIRGYRKFHMGNGFLHGTAFPQRWWPGPNEARCLVLKPEVPHPGALFDEGDKGYGPGGMLLIAHDGNLVPRPGYTYAECPDGVARGNHGCGFYARHGECLEYDPGDNWIFRVTGVIDAWGQIEVGPRGFRAQYAQVVALTAYELPSRVRQLIDELEERLELLDPESKDWLDTHWRLAKLYDPVIEWEMVEDNYREIPTFATEEQMLEAFPVPNLKELYE